MRGSSNKGASAGVDWDVMRLRLSDLERRNWRSVLADSPKGAEVTDGLTTGIIWARVPQIRRTGGGGEEKGRGDERIGGGASNENGEGGGKGTIRGKKTLAKQIQLEPKRGEKCQPWDA